MALAKLFSRAQLGIDAPLVTVEVHLSGGLPSFTIVGLAETAVRESRERVRSALLLSGFDYPQRRITVSLSPADIPKEGGRFDLAIALGILQASNQINTPHLNALEFYAELGLDGQLRPVAGLFPALLACQRAQKSAVVAPVQQADAGLAGCRSVERVSTLLELCHSLQTDALVTHVSQTATEAVKPVYQEMAQIRGQHTARLALELTATGGHNLLMQGPPGSGKSLLAHALAGILPPLTPEQAREAAALHSITGQPIESLFAGLPPIRSPHHSASATAIIGGGSNPRPGEVSLAHHGVLFLDEVAESSRATLDMLREPLETGQVTIARAKARLTFPAQFMLVAAMNPCPCGYYGDGSDRCVCPLTQIERYQARLSGPLRDRFDLQLTLDAVNQEDLIRPGDLAEDSLCVRERVRLARDRQWQRQGCLNSHLDLDQVQQLLAHSTSLQQLYIEASSKLRLSARSTHRLLRVARTLADMQAAELIEEQHLLQALSYRH